MRAVQFTEYGPPGVVHVASVTAPHAEAGTIRIAVRASGFSAGETLIRSGRLRAVIPATFPFRTGFDAAGVVDEVGAGVSGVAVGDEVFGMTRLAGRGANADQVVLAFWAPKPASWSWAEAGGAAGSVETATRVLDRLAIGAGQTVLVQGAAGGTGSVVVQMAVARGARVIGTASERNHDFLRALGVEPTTYGPGLVERVRALAAAGVDAVVDCARGALPDLIALTGDPGRVVTIADLEAAKHGVHLSRVASADQLAVHGLGIAVQLAAEGRLRIPVAAELPLTSAAAAHELSETGHAPGRIVLIHQEPPAL
ncbi:MAG: NADP-dependent oxidoreductase [Actinoplanes sp.]